MKKLIYLFSFLCILSFYTYSQLNNGGFHAKFGVDADTRAGSLKYGPVKGNITSDDWFALPGSSGRGIVDTSNAAYFRTLLQSNRNISFTKNMAEPLYSQINGTLWLDGIYMRDYTTAIGSDSTAYGTAAKNGDDPRNWNGTATNIPGKTDFLDTYAHFRRDGTNVRDSLWLFTGIGTLSTQGERYFDIELFKNSVTYNSLTGRFSSAGTSFGHTEWLFDASGNIIQTGDLIFAVSYKSGEAPVIDVRIWVSRVSFNTVTPALFKFGANFDSSIPGGSAGYATIVSKSGNTYFGSGIGNVSTSSANDTTYATPWGTRSQNINWTANYESLQFVEIGINFTRIGIDPALYKGLESSLCDRIFHSLFFKSRSSNSFSANLQDFAGPINFSVPALNYSIKTDTLRCNKLTGTLSVLNAVSVGTYHWKTFDGNIIGANADSTTITINKKGTYQLFATLATGCSQTRTDNIIVLTDSIPPVASADMGAPGGGQMQLLGGDPALSNVLTPFGRSRGLLWEWTGPNNFTSSLQNPTIDGRWCWGAYGLTVTEARNGCKARASLEVSFSKRPGGVTREETIDSRPPYLRKEPSGTKLCLVVNQQINADCKLSIFNSAGQLIYVKNIQLARGTNNIELPVGNLKQVKLIRLHIGNRLAYAGKAMF